MTVTLPSYDYLHVLARMVPGMPEKRVESLYDALAEL